MVTSLYTADIKLNKTDKDFRRVLMLYNPEDGVLLVEHGLFSISFLTLDNFINQVEVKDKRHIGDINL